MQKNVKKEKKEVQEETSDDIVREPVDELAGQEVERSDGAATSKDDSSGDGEDNPTRGAVGLSGVELEQVLHGLAVDVSNIRVNEAEAKAYAETANEMGDSDNRLCEDGVHRGKQYYIEKHFQFKLMAKYNRLQISRRMIEHNITYDILNEFINKVVNGAEKKSEN